MSSKIETLLSLTKEASEGSAYLIPKDPSDNDQIVEILDLLPERGSDVAHDINTEDFDEFVAKQRAAATDDGDGTKSPSKRAHTSNEDYYEAYNKEVYAKLRGLRVENSSDPGGRRYYVSLGKDNVTVAVTGFALDIPGGKYAKPELDGTAKVSASGDDPCPVSSSFTDPIDYEGRVITNFTVMQICQEIAARDVLGMDKIPEDIAEFSFAALARWREMASEKDAKDQRVYEGCGVPNFQPGKINSGLDVPIAKKIGDTPRFVDEQFGLKDLYLYMRTDNEGIQRKLMVPKSTEKLSPDAFVANFCMRDKDGDTVEYNVKLPVSGVMEYARQEKKLLAMLEFGEHVPAARKSKGSIAGCRVAVQSVTFIGRSSAGGSKLREKSLSKHRNKIPVDEE